MADETLELSLLFDFFGDLLSEKQRDYFDLCFNDDMSLSEVSGVTGVSRQAVRDGLVAAKRQLREYEEKTGVVQRFMELRQGLGSLEEKAQALADMTGGPAHRLALEILEGIGKLKG